MKINEKDRGQLLRMAGNIACGLVNFYGDGGLMNESDMEEITIFVPKKTKPVYMELLSIPAAAWHMYEEDAPTGNVMVMKAIMPRRTE